MGQPISAFQQATQELPERDPAHVEEGTDRQATAPEGYVPASARRFRITNLQQWIDLCA